MSNEHLRGFSTSLVTMEIQMKTTMTYNYTSIKTHPIKKNLPYEVLVTMWRNSDPAVRYVNWSNHFWKQLGYSISRHLPKRKEVYIHTKTCTWMHTLFVVVKYWKKLKRLLTGKWINKLWHIHAMEHYSAIQRNELFIQQQEILE